MLSEAGTTSFPMGGGGGGLVIEVLFKSKKELSSDKEHRLVTALAGPGNRQRLAGA